MSRFVTAVLTVSIGALALASFVDTSHVTTSNAERVLFRVDSTRVVGITNGLQILMYADGSATVDFGSGGPRSLADTVRLGSMPGFTLDITDGAVHVEVVAGQLSGGGVIALSGFVIKTNAQRESAVGRHLLVERGGRGIRTIDRGNPRLLH